MNIRDRVSELRKYTVNVKKAFGSQLPGLEKLSEMAPNGDISELLLVYGHTPSSTPIYILDLLNIIESESGVSLSNQKVSALLNRLSTAGLIKKVPHDKIFYFVRESTSEVSSELPYYIKLYDKAGRIPDIKIERFPNIDGYIQQLREEKDIDDPNISKHELDGKDLIQYLKYIALLENDIYELGKRYQQLADQFPEDVHSAIDLSAKAICMKVKDFCANKQNRDEEDLIKPVKPDDFDLSEPEIPSFETPHLFNKKAVEAKNAELQASYEQQKKNYDEAYKRYQDSVQKYDSDLKEYERRKDEQDREFDNVLDGLDKDFGQREIMAVHHAYDIEIDELKSTLEKIIDALYQLYNKNVIYRKYRNGAAVSTFIDYLEAGRCSSLDGPDGAYNLYESELRTNLVMDKLDEIVNRLDTIKANQFYMYDQISKANHRLESIQGELIINNVLTAVGLAELSEANDKLDEINYNTKVTSYYSKKNNDTLEAIKYISLFT